MSAETEQIPCCAEEFVSWGAAGADRCTKGQGCALHWLFFFFILIGLGMTHHDLDFSLSSLMCSLTYGGE